VKDDASTHFSQSTPPTGPSDAFVSIAGGGHHTCGLRKDGAVQCWGRNDLGQTSPTGTNLALCGNGIREPAEVCDDQNTSPNDGCSTNCRSRETCGNGILDASTGEVCDDGGDLTGNFCDSACQVSTRCDASGTPGGTMEELCDDNNECTVPTCSAQTGCVQTPLNGGEACADGLGRCLTGGCVVPTVSVFDRTGCVLNENGALRCWGDNTNGAATPVAGTYIDVDVGSGLQGCGVQTSGNVECWGNVSGTLTNEPRGVIFKQVEATEGEACGLKPDGTVRCWGNSGNGVSPPPPITGTTVQLEAGFRYMCARKSDLSIQCWGNNTQVSANEPTSGQYTDMAAGRDHACAIGSDGVTVCWGPNTNGRGSPPAGVVFTRLTAGQEHTCGITTSGTTECWGAGKTVGASPNFGQSIPLKTAADGFVVLAAGSFNTCGLRRFGGVRCWGRNEANQSNPTYAAGNAVYDAFEACDDGNQFSGDGCSSTDQSREVCGNGYTDVTEVCDDGENLAGDWCSDDCQLIWSEIALSDPSLYFNFDESRRSDTTYTNLGVGPAAAGNIFGTVTTGVTGISGQAARFPGTLADYLNAGSSPARSTSVTAAAWVYVAGTTAHTIPQQLISYRDLTNQQLGWAFEATQNAQTASFSAGDGLPGGITSTSSPASVSLNTWTHLAATFDAASHDLKLYVNGLQSGATVTSTLAGVGHAESILQIGRALNGTIDEAAMWESALPAQSIADIHEMGTEGRSIEAQMSTASVSPCKDMLAQDPTLPNSVYVTESGPLFCDMTGGGWTMVFKASTGAAGMPRDVWVYAPVSPDDQTLLNRNKNGNYSSRLLQSWTVFEDARVELVTAGTVVKTIVFDTRGSGVNDWFSPNRVVSSSWTDLPTSATWEGSAVGRYFSISGVMNRGFYINNNWGGCNNDTGWLTVMGSLPFCTAWEPATPVIKYASGTTAALLTSFATADAFIVFAR
jgi:cysteine-rich repeat protein